MPCKSVGAIYLQFLSLFGFFIITTISQQLRISITSNEVRRTSFKRDQRAVRLVLAMNVAYLICWSPYAMLCFLHICISKRYANTPVDIYTDHFKFYIFKVLRYYFQRKPADESYLYFFSVIGPILSMVPTITVKLSVVINPIMYIVSKQQVRQYYNSWVKTKNL